MGSIPPHVFYRGDSSMLRTSDALILTRLSVPVARDFHFSVWWICIKQ